jgi:hypothetical protein
MSWTPTEHTWDPKQQPSRFADTTENIHRVIAWIYGVIGALVTLVVAIAADKHSLGIALAIGAFFGAIVLLHAALSAGARRRSEVAKFGSVAVGVLMLFGFPIGTIVGGMLIYNGVQNWPPRRDATSTPAGRDLRDA